jgi:FAD:protein FMN transferase
MSTFINQNTWSSHHFYAMGSHMTAWLDLADQSLADQTLQQVAALFQAAETRLTRFTKSSELAQVNAQSGQWTPVSNVLWRLVVRSLQLAKATDGYFDPTVLNAVEATGYDRDFAQLAQQTQPTNGAHRLLATQATRGCWQQVELDYAQHAIRLPAGTRLDLGGIAKGDTAQQAVTFLSQWGPCLVDAGGDLVAGDAPTGWPGWPVGIANPIDARNEGNAVHSDLAQLWLKNSALATSGVDYRRWQHNGVQVHHLIDPHTGTTATTDLLTVSVLAADAAVAEAWAKAALIAGAATGQAWLTRQQIAAALVDQHHQLTCTPALQPFIQPV